VYCISNRVASVKLRWRHVDEQREEEKVKKFHHQSSLAVHDSASLLHVSRPPPSSSNGEGNFTFESCMSPIVGSGQEAPASEV